MTPPFPASRASSPYAPRRDAERAAGRGAGRDAAGGAGPASRWDSAADSGWGSGGGSGRERGSGWDSGREAGYPARTGWFARFGRELGYLLAGLPVGIAAFTVAVTGFALGVGSFVTVLGLPVLIGTLAAARAFARAERRQVERITGRALPPHHYRESGGGGLSGWLRALRDPQSWRDLAHMVVAFPVRVVSFSLAVAWTIGGLGELLYATWSWSLPRDEDTTGLLDLMFDVESRLADIAFHTFTGVVLLATAIPVIRLLAAVQTGLARALLTNPTAARRAGADWHRV